MQTTSFALALSLVAMAIPSVSSAQAEVGCVSHHFSFKRDGVTQVEGSTGRGQPCQIMFGRLSNILDVKTVSKPAHGILGISPVKEGDRRYIAYAPSAGYTGHDRFEVSVQFIPPGTEAHSTTVVRVDMEVTP